MLTALAYNAERAPPSVTATGQVESLGFCSVRLFIKRGPTIVSTVQHPGARRRSKGQVRTALLPGSGRPQVEVFLHRYDDYSNCLQLAPLMAAWDIPQPTLVMKRTHSTRRCLLLWLGSLRHTASDRLRESLKTNIEKSGDKEAEHNAKRRQRAGPRQDLVIVKNNDEKVFTGASAARRAAGDRL